MGIEFSIVWKGSPGKLKYCTYSYSECLEQSERNSLKMGTKLHHGTIREQELHRKFVEKNKFESFKMMRKFIPSKSE